MYGTINQDKVCKEDYSIYYSITGLIGLQIACSGYNADAVLSIFVQLARWDITEPWGKRTVLRLCCAGNVTNDSCIIRIGKRNAIAVD